jgi:P27 family predicted phage terminase small subunit
MAVTKAALIELLKERGVYNDVDESIVGEFISVQKMMSDAKREIRNNGILTPCNNEGTLFNQNPAVPVYYKALDALLKISRKFGFTPRDRAELKIEADGEDIDL